MKTYKELNALRALVIRDFSARFKGSVLGFFWCIINPLFLLVVYTLVFSKIFEIRWDLPSSNSTVNFSIMLFSGLMVFNLISEVLTRSATAITQNKVFIKQMIFPVKILPVVCIITAFINFLISFTVWLAFYFYFHGFPPLTILFLPLLIVPLLLLSIGISFFLSAFTVFVRDAGQFSYLLSTILLFTSPIFYQASMVPENLQFFLALNPLTTIIEGFRDVSVFGKFLEIRPYFIAIAFSALVAVFGFSFFSFTSKRFPNYL